MNIENIAHHIGELQAEVRALRLEVMDLKHKQEALMMQAQRWRGGFMVVLSLGAAAGWLFDHIHSFFSR